MLNLCFRKMTCNVDTKPLKLRCKRHRRGLSLPQPLHSNWETYTVGSPCLTFLLPSFFAPILRFIRSSVSLRCKHCRIQRCPCLVAVWKSILVIRSTFLCRDLSWSEIGHSPQRSGGSLKPQALKRKSFSHPHEMCFSRKEWKHLFKEYFSLWYANSHLHYNTTILPQ